MKAIIQRVTSASVSVENTVIGSIGQGLLILVAVHVDDSETSIQKLADKISNLRIFEDGDGKLNRSIMDINGEILLVSQFTLYGNCEKGNRPSFIEAAGPEKANEYYEKLITSLRAKGLTIATGKFRSYMAVSLVNDGPTTIIMEI